MGKTSGFAKKITLLSSLVVLLGIITLFAISAVDNHITSTDELYINKILVDSGKSNIDHQNYSEELKFIQYVQSRVLAVAPLNKGLPENVAREPEVLFKNRKGLCYDRSRVIEKILRSKGFETRHLYIYSIIGSKIHLAALFKAKNPSHAISEVKTSKGWMFVDSNSYFLGLDEQNNPISIELLKEKGFNTIRWSNYNNLNYSVIYRRPFDYIYGLYSRHGKFYPPYNFVPDIVWAEFIENF
jgi:hypothetical protein